MRVTPRGIKPRRWFGAIGIAICAMSLVPGAGHSLQDDETRDITKDWKPKRAQAKSSAPAPRIPQYSVKTKIPKQQDRADSAGNSEVGLSVWRLRPSKSSDQVRDLIQPKADGRKEEWTAECVESTSALSDGQLVRLTIESLRTGYLYVIDRARYGDGTYGDPYLIFPTMRLNNGDNRVRAGRLVQIPDPQDKPPYLELHRGTSKQGSKEDSEELLILVTPEPLDALRSEPDRVRLSPGMVELLKQRYGAPIELSQMKGGAGRPESKAEDLAAKDPVKLLAADDPYPQTIYRVAVGPGDPMLVTVNLRVVD